MESKSRELPPASRAAFGPLKEAKNLHANGAASLAELKEFLGQLKGKNPQEVIGMVSASMLIQSMGLAVVATVVLMVVGTVIPYFMYGPPKPKELATKPGAAAKDSREKDSGSAKTDAKAQGATTDGAKSKTPDAAKAAKAMGIDEVKEADPTKNPLDKGPNIDNLLDGLDKN
jgi:hypothetical protein